MPEPGGLIGDVATHGCTVSNCKLFHTTEIHCSYNYYLKSVLINMISTLVIYLTGVSSPK